MRPKHVVIGRIVAAHGLRGEVRALPLSDHPGRLEDLEWVDLLADDGAGVERVRGVGTRAHNKGLLMSLEGVTDRNAAEALRGRRLTVPGDQVPELPDDEYYAFDLIGMQVETEGAEPLGAVDEIMAAGGSNVLVVRGGPRGEILLPAAREVLRHIDPQRRRIVVHPLPGLLPE